MVQIPPSNSLGRCFRHVLCWEHLNSPLKKQEEVAAAVTQTQISGRRMEVFHEGLAFHVLCSVDLVSKNDGSVKVLVCSLNFFLLDHSRFG